MRLKIISLLFAVSCISALNGFIDSKLRALEPILKCYEAKGPRFADFKKMTERINPNSEADLLTLSCIVIQVSSQTNIKLGKLNQDIFRGCLQGEMITV